MIRTKESLKELIDSEKFQPYIQADEDRGKNCVWSVFGDCRYNLLWVVLTNTTSGEQAIECILSRVSTPPMNERVFGIDEADAELVGLHAEYMWDKYEEKISS